MAIQKFFRSYLMEQSRSVFHGKKLHGKGHEVTHGFENFLEALDAVRHERRWGDGHHNQEVDARKRFSS
jgi:hypothetical protein